MPKCDFNKVAKQLCKVANKLFPGTSGTKVRMVAPKK